MLDKLHERIVSAIDDCAALGDVQTLDALQAMLSHLALAAQQRRNAVPARLRGNCEMAQTHERSCETQIALAKNVVEAVR